MKRLGFTLVKNAFANVVRGGASAIVALVLPHFLTRDLTVAQFSAWVLMLQVAAWSSYLDFGLQTAVARYVAKAIERHDRDLRDRVISTAFFLLLAAGILAISVALVVVWKMPLLFHSSPLGLLGELRGGVVILSVASAAMLPLSTFSGILIGLHRNEFPAFAIGGTRILGAIAILCLVHYTRSLAWLALCLGAFNLLGGIFQYGFARRLLPEMRIRWQLVTGPITRELAHYCTGLTAFSFGMLLVSGLDLTIVGYFAFAATGFYAIASTVIGFMVGLSGSVFSALLAPLAVLQERREYARIHDLVLTATRLGSYASLVAVSVVLLAGRPLLTLWVGPQYASKALPILEILLWAQAIRLTASAYSVALIATAQQNLGIATAITEGLANLVASILGAYLLGPIGVAWGTVIGSVCGVLSLIFWVMPKAQELSVYGSEFAAEAVLRPLFCFLPILFCATVLLYRPLPIAAVPIAVLATGLLLFWEGRIQQISLLSLGRSNSAADG